MDTVDAPFPHRCELGEMPLWDAESRRLHYVDINGGEIHRLDPATGSLESIVLSAPLSFAIPVDASTDLVCGNGNDVIVIDAGGAELGRMPIEPGMAGNRLNEGKADPRGRLWTGSMSTTRAPGESGLYRVGERGLHKISTITLGNGTDWDVDRRRMYHVDSTTQQIDVWDYDVDTGEVENRRAWATIDPDDGLPDGLTIDAEGCVWLCLFQGGVVRRFDPDGAPMRDIALPTRFATCPGFGGDDLATMFVTTSRHKLAPDERAGDPLAGALLVLDAGVTGRPSNRLAPAVAAMVAA
jgi:sugar lactone lactonase YvrE